MNQPAGPVADFAGILDGHTLWLAVPAGAGPLTLRERETGDEHPLPADGTGDARWSSVRADLLDLPGTGDASYAVEHGGLAVLAPEPPPDNPTRTPVDGPVAFDLDRDDQGALLVLRSQSAPVAWVKAVSADDDGVVTLRIGVPEGAATPERLVVLQRGERVGRVPVSDGIAVLTPELADSLGAEPCRFVVAAGRDRWRLRRMHNDLVRPQASVALPSLGSSAELAWAPSGDLRLRPAGSES